MNVTRYCDQVEMGDELASVEKEVTDQMVLDFCEVWSGGGGMGRFTDHEAARKEGLPGAILPGIMSMSYMAQFLAGWADGGLVKKLDVVFRQPVVHPQTISLVGVITDKNQVGDENQVECDVYIQNSHGDRLVGGKATVVLPRGK
ncbi:MAG: MaoC/PaaZ C-terminal domain-containing protein [Chloroflexota bacterium]